MSCAIIWCTSGKTRSSSADIAGIEKNIDSSFGKGADIVVAAVVPPGATKQAGDSQS